MNIKFTIPGPESINVEIVRDSFTGRFQCFANGRAYELKSPLALGTHFNFRTVHNYRVEVPEAGKHVIEIEHRRPRFFGGLRPQRYIVKVDGNLAADETGY